ncbi:MAG: hypothetical protein EOP53_08785, partial [Sphingobacteriales bacterium]
LWTMDYGLWTMDYGLWTMDYGLWTMNYALLPSATNILHLWAKLLNRRPCCKKLKKQQITSITLLRKRPLQVLF